jgi:hypothetical protein
MRCTCLSVVLGGKYKTCEYHDWKKARHERALKRRTQRNRDRRIRRRLARSAA